MQELLSKITISLFCINILFASMLPNVDALDIVKFPNLVKHFYYHHQKDSNIDFIEFVSLHYGSKSNEHNKQENHRSLPFQSTHSSDNLSNFVYLDLDNFKTSPVQIRISFFSFYNHKIESNYSERIWQPPKSTI